MDDVKTYNIPILYEAEGQILIEAISLEDALKGVEKMISDDQEYIIKESINFQVPKVVIDYREAQDLNYDPED